MCNYKKTLGYALNLERWVVVIHSYDPNTVVPQNG